MSARRMAAALAVETAERDLAPDYSDEALALEFARRYADRLRYVAAWGRWLEWDGRRWKPDTTLRAFDLARSVCRDAASRCNRKNRGGIASAKTVAAVERLARADRRFAATVEQWDADPWLLNTPDGIVDLRTGDIEPHRVDAYMTRITAAAPGCDCPLWLAFLDRITGGDRERQDYLRRFCGYALTGSTREHVLPFGHGVGANGKSVFVSTVAGLMGDYAKTAPIETFTASNNDRHPTDLAGLMGARLVTAVETEEGRRWAESRIKSLTGGDKVSARFMRQDFFEYVPQFKLLIVGNHKPGLRSVDEAIRRRFHLIPFDVTIPPDERDPELTEKIRKEWPGILEWMIEGCLEWQTDGLRPPEAVLSATAAYLDAQDALAAWIEECCERSPDGWESRAALFDSWTKWANASGEHVGTRARFLDALQDRGFEPAGRRGQRGFRGLNLVRQDLSDAPWNR